MSIEAFIIQELPEATVEDIYNAFKEKVDQVVEDRLSKVVLLERNSLGKVAVRDLVTEFPSGPKTVDGEALEQAAAKIIEDLEVNFDQGKRLQARKQPELELPGYLRIERREFETNWPGVVCQREDFYDGRDGSPRGMRLMLVNRQPKSAFQTVKKGFLDYFKY